MTPVMSNYICVGVYLWNMFTQIPKTCAPEAINSQGGYVRHLWAKLRTSYRREDQAELKVVLDAHHITKADKKLCNK